jgi:hypothetical protein
MYLKKVSQINNSLVHCNSITVDESYATAVLDVYVDLFETNNASM